MNNNLVWCHPLFFVYVLVLHLFAHIIIYAQLFTYKIVLR